ncbi:hypothetical protein J2W42_002913 [Rhizobium tibeticum]|nr:hypothetical protein [Rhizobium tibeticum]
MLSLRRRFIKRCGGVPSSSPQLAEPDWGHVHRELKRKHVTLPPNGHESPARSSRRNVSRTVEGAAPTRAAIDLWPRPPSNLCLRISRTRRIFSLSAGIAFLPLSAPKGGTSHQQETPTNTPIRGRHHLGTRGRLFLGIGGRHHFGIRGRHASEFAWRVSRLKNRIRFPLEIFEVVHDAFPSDRPVTVRVSATDWADGGWDLESTVAFTTALEARGCSAIHVSSGGLAHHQHISIGPSYQVPFAN